MNFDFTISRRDCKYLLFTFQYPGHKAEKHPEIPGLLRIKLWLGLSQQEEEWHKMQKEGDMAVFAETVSSHWLDG